MRNVSMPSPETLKDLAAEYTGRTGYPLTVVCADGAVWLPKPVKDDVPSGEDCRKRLHIVCEALRWGEPSVQLTGEDRVSWGIPLTLNNELCGGAVVLDAPVYNTNSGKDSSAPYDEVFEGPRIREACETLRSLVIEHNLANAALLDRNRDESQEERLRAETIHVLKAHPYRNTRDLYLRLEPALLAAIGRGDRQEARGLLNQVLLEIFFPGGESLELRKGFLMELVVMMYRSAVEAGANPDDILGLNFNAFYELSRIEDDESLSAWCRRTLETLIDIIRDNRNYTQSSLAQRAMSYMQNHLGETLSRDETARHVGLSPSHFSRLIKNSTGKTYQDMLRTMRVEKTRRLLRHTELSVAEISLQCGFFDQSHLTRVFHQIMGCTPRQYRQK